VGSALRSGYHDASDVSYVAVHGTGTPLGDPIEVGALAHVLAQYGSAAVSRVALGSVKVLSAISVCVQHCSLHAP
jgi:acyl transferase domain-containing protein